MYGLKKVLSVEGSRETKIPEGTSNPSSITKILWLLRHPSYIGDFSNNEAYVVAKSCWLSFICKCGTCGSH